MPIDHVNIRCTDLNAMCGFLEDAVGLKIGDRPPFAFPGAWLYDGTGQAIVHLIEVEADPGADGPIDHVAFQVTDFDHRIQRLQQDGHAVSVREIPGTGLSQAFLDGPGRVRIELQPERSASV